MRSWILPTLLFLVIVKGRRPPENGDQIATEIVVKNVNEIAIKIEEGIENEIRRMKNEESLHKKM
jgi:hypothetical protein